MNPRYSANPGIADLFLRKKTTDICLDTGCTFCSMELSQYRRRQRIKISGYGRIFLGAHFLSPMVGRNAVNAPELPVETGRGRIPHLHADLGDGTFAIVQQLAGVVNADDLEIIQRRPAEGFLEQPPEMGGTDMAQFRQLIDGDVVHVVFRAAPYPPRPLCG